MAKIERMSLEEARNAYRAKTGHCRHCDFCIIYSAEYFCQVKLEAIPKCRESRSCEYYQPREAR